MGFSENIGYTSTLKILIDNTNTILNNYIIFNNIPIDKNILSDLLAIHSIHRFWVYIRDMLACKIF